MESKLEDMWYCYMNPDPSRQSCDMPEDEWQSPALGWIYTFQGFLVGQLVWAKMITYPPWPSIISPDPWCSNTFTSREDNGLLYHVEFLGKTRSHLWLPEEKVEPYQKSCTLEGHKSYPGNDYKYNRRLQHAITEADHLVTMSDKERLALCHYTEEKKERLENSKKVTSKKTSKLLSQHQIDHQSSNTAVSDSSTKRTDFKSQGAPEVNDKLINPYSLATFPSENVVALLKILHEPSLLNGLFQKNSKSIIGSTKPVNDSHHKPIMTVTEKLTSKKDKCSPPCCDTASRPAKRKGKPPIKPGNAIKKKKQCSVNSQSILRYFEPQESNSTNDDVSLVDQVVPESIDQINNESISESSEGLYDLERDLEKGMLDLEDMLSQFDTESIQKSGDLDYSCIVEDEMTKIEELLAFCED